jgi:glutamate-1-semialdehyde 2,1-aminomutase
VGRERFADSLALFERARAVIPAGVYGHQTPAFLVEGAYPIFLSQAKGCRIRDPDGHEYIDMVCAYGPMVVGYGNPAVEKAAARQRELCDSMNLPAPVMVELAERLVSLTPGADWAMFAKNGSDVCSWSLAVAREATGRNLVAMVKHSYHGVHGWCNQLHAGFPQSERSLVLEFSWNDLASLERLFAEHRGRIAAVIVTPFRHEAFEPSVMAAPGFIEGIREACSREGAAMIVDDVRGGFRLHMGGSTQLRGVSPDLLLYSKALANGYPLAAMLGNNGLKDAARSVFVTGTFFTQAVPLAAALATIDELERLNAVDHMEAMGRRLCRGLEERAQAAGIGVTISGPPAIPFMTFDEDEGGFERSRVFAAACLKAGTFLHPVHNWFVSAAHQDEDIDQVLKAADEGFAAVSGEF